MCGKQSKGWLIDILIYLHSPTASIASSQPRRTLSLRKLRVKNKMNPFPSRRAPPLNSLTMNACHISYSNDFIGAIKNIMTIH